MTRIKVICKCYIFLLLHKQEPGKWVASVCRHIILLDSTRFCREQLYSILVCGMLFKMFLYRTSPRQSQKSMLHLKYMVSHLLTWAQFRINKCRHKRYFYLDVLMYHISYNSFGQGDLCHQIKSKGWWNNTFI